MNLKIIKSKIQLYNRKRISNPLSRKQFIKAEDDNVPVVLYIKKMTNLERTIKEGQIN